MPRVVVITTGGTIASRPDPVTGGVRPTVSGQDLVDAVPGLAAIAEVEVESYANVLGPVLNPDDLLAIAMKARAANGRPEIAGVVVTAGTGIIEEGSYLCDLLAVDDKPI